MSNNHVIILHGYWDGAFNSLRTMCHNVMLLNNKSIDPGLEPGTTLVHRGSKFFSHVLERQKGVIKYKFDTSKY